MSVAGFPCKNAVKNFLRESMFISAVTSYPMVFDAFDVTGVIL